MVMSVWQEKTKVLWRIFCPTVTMFIANAIHTLPKFNPAFNGGKPAGDSLNQLWHCQSLY